MCMALTIRLRFGHFTANDKLRFVLNVFTLPVCPYLGLKIRRWQLAAAMFVFIHLLNCLQNYVFFFEKEFDDQ